MAFKSNKLANLFIKSAVRQVGRDAGRVVSNNVFGDSHSAPIRVVGQLNTKSNHGVPYVDTSEFDLSNQPLWQPESRSWGKYALYWTICLVTVLPFFIMSFFKFFRAFGLIFKKETDVYAVVPRRVRDRRYKKRYRDEGYMQVATNQKRLFTDLELEVRRKVAKVDLLNCFTGILGTLLAIYYAITDESYSKLVNQNSITV